MAEWSKALVLGTSNFGCAGSNPAPVILFLLCGGLAQSVECVVRNDEAPGSKPGFSNLLAPQASPYQNLPKIVPRPGLEPGPSG